MVLGASGMLGRSWCNYLQGSGIEHVALTRPEVDLTKPDTLDAELVDAFGHVINCAAWTDVDGAESAETRATSINGHAVSYLAERCKERNIILVHYSTDYVFNGTANSPYHTDHPRDPINAYGRSKAVGEQQLEASGCAFLLIRSSWLYAPWGKNIVRKIARLAAERDELRFVTDQRGRPSSVEHLTAATTKLLEGDATGIYHITDGGDCNWFEFARRTVELLGSPCHVEPGSTADVPRRAQRPRYSVLDLAKTEVITGSMPCWQSNLTDVVKRLEPETR